MIKMHTKILRDRENNYIILNEWADDTAIIKFQQHVQTHIKIYPLSDNSSF